MTKSISAPLDRKETRQLQSNWIRNKHQSLMLISQQGTWGLWSRPQRGQGGGKGAEGQDVLWLTRPGRGTEYSAPVLDCLCPGMVLTVCESSETTSTHCLSPTHPYDHRQQRQHKEQAGREASWLKEVRKVKRVVKSEKWVTRPRGEK